MAAIDDVLETMNGLLRDAGAQLMATADQEVGSKKWNRIVIDCRFGPVRTTSLSKDAVYLPDGTRKPLNGSADALFVIRRAHKLVRNNESLKDVMWYGIILTALSDGTCRWELLTDQNCIDEFELEW